MAVKESQIKNIESFNDLEKSAVEDVLSILGRTEIKVNPDEVIDDPDDRTIYTLGKELSFGQTYLIINSYKSQYGLNPFIRESHLGEANSHMVQFISEKFKQLVD